MYKEADYIIDVGRIVVFVKSRRFAGRKDVGSDETSCEKPINETKDYSGLLVLHFGPHLRNELDSDFPSEQHFGLDFSHFIEY